MRLIRHVWFSVPGKFNSWRCYRLDRRFETGRLTQPGYLMELAKLSGNMITRLREHYPMRELILDMDSSVSEAYNRHFGCTGYDQLFHFDQPVDVDQSLLREGKVHSVKDW
jgi:hypothetical protein